MRTIRIATRKSPLALWQAEFIKARLESLFDVSVELLGFKTRGDKILDTPLAKVGGKGLFVKELEHAMLNGEADIAVHSMKDVPMEFPEGLGLVAICEREDPFDAFVSNKYNTFAELPNGAVVGTSSLRRECQLRAARPDIEVKTLRGNVNTRLAKLDAGEFDAIILACSGLKRLEMHDRIASTLEEETCLPAGGQGALGIETRLEDSELVSMLEQLNHQPTATCVRAERAMNRHLQGGCQVPIACYGILQQDNIYLRGLVGSPAGDNMLYVEKTASASDPEALGVDLASQLLEMGAGEILEAVYGQ